MPAVLYVAEEDRRPKLSKTVLGRDGIAAFVEAGAQAGASER